ncbi:MAG: protein-export chaperone SecB [Pseudomonadales bacterium]
MAEQDEVKGAASEAQNAENQPQFALQRLFLKDISFESPNSPEVFLGQWAPQVKMDVNTGAKSLENDLYEVVLTITVTVENADKVAYLIEVKQAGIFGLKNIDEDTKKQAIGTICPTTLFPYAREAVDNMATRGGFPPLHLAPMNFDALYAEAVNRQAEPESGDTTH